MGVGLRPAHLSEFLDRAPKSVEWVEAITETYLPWAPERRRRVGPHDYSPSFLRPVETLERVRANLPVALHGVSMNLGSTDELNGDYLKALKTLIARIQPEWVSDHLCWTGVEGVNLHDLYPLPYTAKALAHVVSRIERVQQALGRRILVENVSSYAEFAGAEMTEVEFLSEVARRSGCGILLDLNNVYVSARNHGFDPRAYLEGVRFESVGQIHLAGHAERDGILVDTHDQPVPEAVWELFTWYTGRYGLRPTMIERDANIPEWSELEREVLRGKGIRDARAAG
jgi:uncharacterized protein (UPF0276 family)